MQYDYVVVGSGSSGSVVAARLFEDGQSRVLVLEAGGLDRTLRVLMPGWSQLEDYNAPPGEPGLRRSRRSGPLPRSGRTSPGGTRSCP